jgi:hypothetical protein
MKIAVAKMHTLWRNPVAVLGFNTRPRSDRNSVFEPHLHPLEEFYRLGVVTFAVVIVEKALP